MDCQHTNLLSKIQGVQNAAARLIFKESKFCNITGPTAKTAALATCDPQIKIQTTPDDL